MSQNLQRCHSLPGDRQVPQPASGPLTPGLQTPFRPERHPSPIRTPAPPQLRCLRPRREHVGPLCPHMRLREGRLGAARWLGTFAFFPHAWAPPSVSPSRAGSAELREPPLPPSWHPLSAEASPGGAAVAPRLLGPAQGAVPGWRRACTRSRVPPVSSLVCKAPPLFVLVRTSGAPRHGRRRQRMVSGGPGRGGHVASASAGASTPALTPTRSASPPCWTASWLPWLPAYYFHI